MPRLTDLVAKSEKLPPKRLKVKGVIPCGQSCPGKPRGYPRKRIGELMKGDILPACPHRVKVKVLRYVRKEIAGQVLLVRTMDSSRTKFETILYGTKKTKVEVKK